MADERLIGERYKLKEELGKGGMGVVYLARDVLTQKLVALKIMTGYPEDFQEDQKAREKFKMEIQIAQQLDHPHVLRAFAGGETVLDGRKLPYLISEYIPEGSLQDLISRRKIWPWEQWTLTQIADTITQAAQGLQYLHTRKPIIAHRDVKPGNYLVRTKQSSESAAHLYLCDFGLARKQITEADLTSDIRGTYKYMAPEQADGGIHYLMDQYSLAVMACYLLTGQYPIYASSAIAMVMAHKTEKPRPPSVLNAARIKPGRIDKVLLKALAKDPRQRFPTVLEFARELQSAIQDQERTQTGVTAMWKQPGNSADMPTEPTTQNSEIELESAPIILEQIKSYRQDDLDEPITTDAQHKAAPSAKNHSKALRPLQFRQLLRQQLPARPNMLCWSWDGNYVMCLFNDHEPVLVDRKNNNMWHLPVLGVGHAGCWTPEKHVFIISARSKVGKYSQISIHNLGINSEWPPIFPPFAVRSIDALDVSRHRLLAVWIENQILIYHLPSWTPSMEIPRESYNLVAKDMYSDNTGVLRWSPDGSMLAMGARNGTAICWNLDTQTVQWSEPASNRRIYSLAWSPDSTSLAIAFSDKQIVVWNVLERRKRAVWEKLPAIPHVLSISRQQQLMVASSKLQLLFGDLDGAAPSARHPGYLLAEWSPRRSEFATLDPDNDTMLVIWQE